MDFLFRLNTTKHFDEKCNFKSTRRTGTEEQYYSPLHPPKKNKKRYSKPYDTEEREK